MIKDRSDHLTILNILPRIGEAITDWPIIMAPRSHFYKKPRNQTTITLNCTYYVIENQCVRYELRLFRTMSFPYFMSPLGKY